MTMSEGYGAQTLYIRIVSLIRERYWCRLESDNSLQRDPLLEQELWHRDADKIFGLMAMTPQCC